MRRLFLITALFLLSVNVCVAQPAPAAPTAPAPDSVPVFHARSELVFIPVVVNGKKGEHLPGLTKDDFVVEQDGQKRQISVFEEVVEAEPARASTTPEAPDIATNYAVQDERPRRLLIVVIDMVNTPIQDQRRAKDALVRFLSHSLPKDEPVSLLAFDTNGLKQLHSFTTDTAVLIAALKKVSSRLALTETLANDPKALRDTPANTPAGQIEARLLQWESEMATMQNSAKQRDNLRMTLTAMQQVAGAFAGVPGRKAVIWATDGFPFALQDARAMNGLDTEMRGSYDTTFRLLNSANIAVYPVDLEGLTQNGGYSAASKGAPPVGPPNAVQYEGGTLAHGYTMPKVKFDEGHQREDTMRNFASATGGAYIRSNDIEHGFAEAAIDSHSYYLLGYYLTGDNKPGWHKLKVHVDAAHSDMRARDGFFVGEQAASAGAKKREFQLALSSPVDYTGIHFGMKVEPQPAEASGASDKGEKTVGFRLIIPPNQITFGQMKDNLFDLDMVAMAIDSRQWNMGDSAGSARSTLKPEDFKKIMKTGLTMRGAVKVAPGEYELRVALRDNLSGNIGTLRTHIVVK